MPADKYILNVKWRGLLKLKKKGILPKYCNASACLSTKRKCLEKVTRKLLELKVFSWHWTSNNDLHL